jgi:hypothetical protein
MYGRILLLMTQYYSYYPLVPILPLLSMNWPKRKRNSLVIKYPWEKVKKE